MYFAQTLPVSLLLQLCNFNFAEIYKSRTRVYILPPTAASRRYLDISISVSFTVLRSCVTRAAEIYTGDCIVRVVLYHVQNRFEE